MESPDTLNCAENIEVGRVSQETGLKIRGQAMMLSDIAPAIEYERVPETQNQAFPDLAKYRLVCSHPPDAQGELFSPKTFHRSA
jgi:hypothetical protein